MFQLTGAYSSQEKPVRFNKTPWNTAKNDLEMVSNSN